MRSYMMRGALAVVCLAVALVPLPVKAQGSCAAVLTPTLSTTTASPGTNVGVFSRITNCASKKKAYMVVISSVSNCGAETVITSSRISLNGGETKLLSVSYPVAPGTCLGAATVTVSAREGDVTLASESATLSIQ